MGKKKDKLYKLEPETKAMIASGLGALAAVQQQAVPAALRHSGGQGALRQRHGGSRAQQCNGQHKQFLRGSSLLSYHKPRRCTILSAAA